MLSCIGGLCVLRHKVGRHCHVVGPSIQDRLTSLLRSALIAGRLRRQWIVALFPRRHPTPANPCARQCQPLVLLRGRRCALHFSVSWCRSALLPQQPSAIQSGGGI
jgi:hypothetical protein